MRHQPHFAGLFSVGIAGEGGVEEEAEFPRDVRVSRGYRHQADKEGSRSSSGSDVIQIISKIQNSNFQNSMGSCHFIKAQNERSWVVLGLT